MQCVQKEREKTTRLFNPGSLILDIKKTRFKKVETPVTQAS